jgi:hypothetical protein
MNIEKCYDRDSVLIDRMKLNLENDNLTIELEWYEQLWAVTLNQQMQIPLNHIDQATTAEPESNWAEIRAPGTFLPGVIKAGTYYTKHGREFWYVTMDKNYLTLDLHSEPYRRLIITIPDNISWCNRLNGVPM